ncbi:MAG: DUF6516 family protein [Chloroflexota bacterium]
MSDPDPVSYLIEAELALVSSSIVAEYQISRSWANTDDGYIRARVTLTNGDFLEASEYFVLQGGRIGTADYHHQWMDSNKQTLRRRWDSTPHYPKLQDFPHHIHLGATAVVPGRPISLVSILKVLESELS